MQTSLTLSFDVMINLVWSSTDVSTETTCIFRFAIRLLFIASINQLRWQRRWRNATTEEIWRIYCFICRIATRESSSSNYINVSTKSLNSLWASEQSSFNTNALETHMLATRWDVDYKLAVSWVCIVD